MLEQFDYEVVHRSGEKIKHVDALSRLDAPFCLQVGGSITAQLQAAQDRDDGLKAIRSSRNGSTRTTLLKMDCSTKGKKV